VATLIEAFTAMPVAADIYSDTESLLPPIQKWSGKSEDLVVGKDDPWITPAEVSDLTATPGYDETISWLQKLVAFAPELEMVSIGKSLQGRDFWMVIASAEQASRLTTGLISVGRKKWAGVPTHATRT